MKIKFGAIVTDGRGKIGGHVLAKNRSGNYMRTKVTPVNPQTTYQQTQRAALGTLSSGWSGLTDEQRTSWDAAAQTHQRTDIFGDLRTPTGKNQYTGANKNRLNSNLPIISVPIESIPLPSFQIISATANSDVQQIHIQTSDIGSDFYVQIWATAPMSQGTSFVKNKLRLLKTMQQTMAPVFELMPEYEARFGTFTINSNIVVGVVIVNNAGDTTVMQTSKVLIING